MPYFAYKSLIEANGGRELALLISKDNSGASKLH